MFASSKKSQGRLKSIQFEQFSKLLSKHNNESDLLEDMRSFCKQRAILDKEYGQSLQKLCSSFLGKKEYATVKELHKLRHRSVWDVWKLYLHECNSIGMSYLNSAEMHNSLGLELKPLKYVRVVVSKRIFEQLKSLQNDVAAAMQEMVKSQKIFSEEEKQAYEIKVKALNVEEKLRRRSTSLFSSMAQLHRNHAKLSLRRNEFENRSAGARNEYLFQVTAFNAHIRHYLKTEIPDLAQVLDGDIYDRFRKVLSQTTETELDICQRHQNSFKTLLEESSKINRTAAWEHFVQELPVFSEDVQFQIEHGEGDKASTLLPVNASEASFDQVAKKLARRFVTRERRIKAYRKEIGELCSRRASVSLPVTAPSNQEYNGSEDGMALNQEYVENKVEELEFAIRREEIEKTKLQACLDLLKDNAVDVQLALEEAYVTVAAEVETLIPERLQHLASSSSTSGPLSSSTAATGSSSAEGSTVNATTLGTLDSSQSQPQIYGLSLTSDARDVANEGLTQANSSLVLPTTTTTGEPALLRLDADEFPGRHRFDQTSPTNEVDWSGGGRLPKATAMYEFLATRSDEVNLVCSEKVVLLGTGDGEEWVKIRSLLDGNEGLVPRAFLSIDPRPPLQPPHPVVSTPATATVAVATTTTTTTTSSFTSLEPSNKPNEDELPSKAHSGSSRRPTTSSHPPMAQCVAGQFVRALIDFDGLAEDELSFRAGDVIHVCGRPETGNVDDGWIEGELFTTSNGASNKVSLAQGVFPSMLVEAIDAEESWPCRLKALRERQSGKAQSQPTDGGLSEVRGDKLASPSDFGLPSRSSQSINRGKSRPILARGTSRRRRRSVSGTRTLPSQSSSSYHTQKRTPMTEAMPATVDGGVVGHGLRSTSQPLRKRMLSSATQNGNEVTLIRGKAEIHIVEDDREIQIAEL